MPFQVIVLLNSKRIFAWGDKSQSSEYLASKVKEYLNLLQHWVEAGHLHILHTGGKRSLGKWKVIAQGHPAKQKVKPEVCGLGSELPNQPVHCQNSCFVRAEYYLHRVGFLTWSCPGPEVRWSLLVPSNPGYSVIQPPAILSYWLWYNVVNIGNLICMVDKLIFDHRTEQNECAGMGQNSVFLDLSRKRTGQSIASWVYNNIMCVKESWTFLTAHPHALHPHPTMTCHFDTRDLQLPGKLLLPAWAEQATSTNY